MVVCAAASGARRIAVGADADISRSAAVAVLSTCRFLVVLGACGAASLAGIAVGVAADESAAIGGGDLSAARDIVGVLAGAETGVGGAVKCL